VHCARLAGSAGVRKVCDGRIGRSGGPAGVSEQHDGQLLMTLDRETRQRVGLIGPQQGLSGTPDRLIIGHEQQVRSGWAVTWAFGAERVTGIEPA
jgi:hypothetical protein